MQTDQRVPAEVARRSPALYWVVMAVGLAFTATSVLGAAVPKLAEHDFGIGYGGVLVSVFMGSTVAAQLTMPIVLRAVSARTATLIAIVGLGATPIVYLHSSLAVVVAGTALRGCAFGMITVTGPYLSAEHSEPPRRARALGLYGFATSVGAIVSTPLGVILIDDSPGLVVLLAAASASLALVLTVVLVPSDVRRRAAVAGVSLAVLRRAAPVLLPFLLVAAAMGITLSYVALLAPDYAAAALLVAGIGKSAGRTVVSSWCTPTRIGSTLTLTLAVTLLGHIMLAASGNSVGVILAALVAGLGSGAVATLALIGTFSRSAPEEFAISSAAWNLAFNGGMAAGAFTFTGFLAFTSYRGGFALTAVIVAIAAVAAQALSRVHGRQP